MDHCSLFGKLILAVLSWHQFGPKSGEKASDGKGEQKGLNVNMRNDSVRMRGYIEQ
jgi:hypothetical protein